MNRYLGLTLIEMVVTVAVIGILAAVAWPTFDRYQQKVSRADGIAGLQIAANELEQCGSRTFDYTDNTCALSAAAQNSPRGKYGIRISAVTASSFTLEATKQAGGTDSECNAKLVTNNLGQQGIKIGPRNPLYTNNKVVRTCWNK